MGSWGLSPLGNDDAAEHRGNVQHVLSRAWTALGWRTEERFDDDDEPATGEPAIAPDPGDIARAFEAVAIANALTRGGIDVRPNTNLESLAEILDVHVGNDAARRAQLDAFVAPIKVPGDRPAFPDETQVERWLREQSVDYDMWMHAAGCTDMAAAWDAIENPEHLATFARLIGVSRADMRRAVASSLLDLVGDDAKVISAELRAVLVHLRERGAMTSRQATWLEAEDGKHRRVDDMRASVVVLTARLGETKDMSERWWVVNLRLNRFAHLPALAAHLKRALDPYVRRAHLRPIP